MRISDWSSDVCSSDLGLAGRYAVALFDLARESNAINAVLKSLGDLKAGLAESADLHTLVTSPIVGRTDAANAIGAAAKAMNVDSDRKSGGEGKSVSGSVDSGGHRIIQ